MHDRGARLYRRAKPVTISRQAPTALAKTSRHFANVIICFGLAFGSGCAMLGLAEDKEAKTPQSGRSESAVRKAQADQITLRYETEIVGVEDKSLHSLLEESSQLIGLKEKLPATVAGLDRRAETDVQRFQAALRSEGYYSSSIDYRIDREATPVRVTIHVTTGPPYHLAAY